MQYNWRLRAPECGKQTGPSIFFFFRNNTLCSLHQHLHKNTRSVLHLRSWLPTKIQNAIKTQILLSFTSLCNFIIVSSINFERILILASAGSPPPLLSQPFQSPDPASQHPTTDAVRKRRGGGKPAVERCQQGTTSKGTRAQRSLFFPGGSYGNLQCLKICPNMLTSEEKHAHENTENKVRD